MVSRSRFVRRREPRAPQTDNKKIPFTTILIFFKLTIKKLAPMTRPWVVLVAGGHAAGKKTVCKDLVEAVEKLSDGGISLHSDVVHLSDYKVGKRGPKAYDFEKLKQHLDGQEQQMIMVEGLYALYDQQLRDRAVMKVFVDSDADTRLSRWILRDTQGDSSKLGDVLEEVSTHTYA